MNRDEEFMGNCVSLAQKGLGSVAPNPMVGCVIVHENKIIGQGYHEKYGFAHAEVNAINSVPDKSLLNKSTLYVNLEPCSHTGKTPPCTNIITEHKIPYVVIGNVDSNPAVNSKGINTLIKSGVDVKVGVLDKECRELNKRFFTFHEKKRPYIILKWAQSKDNFIASNSKQKDENKKWISNEHSRKLVHQWRTEEQAIMVGTNTALKDNPQLTSRLVKGNSPLRIVLDRQLKTPATYHLLDSSTPTIIFTEKVMDKKSNTEFLKINFENDIIKQILDNLYRRNISSLIVEGGTQLINSFINENYWDEARIFTSAELLKEGIKSPELPSNSAIIEKLNIEGDTLCIYRNYH